MQPVIAATAWNSQLGNGSQQALVGVSSVLARVCLIVALPLSFSSTLYAQTHSTARTATVAVAPVSEITVIDPQTNSEGLPQPLVVGPLENQQVDIPPTLIVHNYYYTGNRDFRGPALPGGPSIIVATHPYTGERLYLSVNMLAGSPRVTYRKSHIDYDFGHQKVRVRFAHPFRVVHRHQPTVSYLKGSPSKLEPAPAPGSGKVSGWVHRTGLPTVMGQAKTVAAGAAHSTADVIRTTGRIVTTPVVQVARSTPLGGLLNRDPAEAAQASRDRAVQQVSAERLRSEASIPTGR